MPRFYVLLAFSLHFDMIASFFVIQTTNSFFMVQFYARIQFEKNMISFLTWNDKK